MSEPETVATPSQTVGPFFHLGMTRDEGLHIVRPSADRDRIQLVITVTDGQGKPVPDAVIELWQAADGSARDCAFGRMGTSTEGICQFETVRPPVTVNANDAPHINVCLFARGLLRQLHTRIYFPDDPALTTDPVLQLVSAERRQTLFASAEQGDPHRWRFGIRLQGAGETVFFAV
jgi:protocatechuate 3,4-dioxygenase alpha subunit